MKPLTTAFAIIVCMCLMMNAGQAQDITTGLVAHYEFENTSGDVIDETGNNNGINYGATRGVTGKIGNAFSYDGTNDYVYVADSPTLNPPNFTLAYWVKSDGAQSGEYDRLSGFSGYDFEMAVGGSTNSLKIYIGVWYDTGYDLTYNSWAHVATTYNGTAFKVYVNGSEIANYTRSRTLSGNLCFASKYTGGECFDGVLDDARLYNRALTATDVQELYNPGGGGSTPTLSVNDITVNEGDGTAAFTVSINQASSQQVSGYYSTSNGTASSGSDYTAQLNQPFSISAGLLNTTVNISITDDSEIEGNETFNLTLTNPTNATISNGTGICTIIDNDVAGGLSCSNTITTFPYTESFEITPTTWENTSEGDDAGWTRHSGSTTSSNTGPATAEDGSYYYYVESSSPNYPNKTAILYGPCFDLAGESSAQFSFYYHMYGAAMGNISLEASTDGTIWTSLWNLNGDQGNSWQQATVNLSSYLGNTVQLRFYGTTGGSYTSDMAIDNLSLSTVSGGSSFWAQSGTNIYPTNSGNVGIGTTSPDQKLTVNGTIHAEEVIVDLSVPAPDYVFEKGYELPPISELEYFIEKNSHLPEFPPAKEMESEGILLSRVNLNLLKRIEELTLYIIEQEKRILEIEKQYKIEIK